MLDCTQIEGLFDSVYFFYCSFDFNMKQQGQSQYLKHAKREKHRNRKEMKKCLSSCVTIKKFLVGRENRIISSQVEKPFLLVSKYNFISKTMMKSIPKFKLPK